MKLRHLLFGVLAGVAFVACTNDNDPAGVTPVKGDNVAAAKYMAVNFAMPGGATTRADGDLVPTDIDESAINDAAFLFFKDGAQVADPFVIAKGGHDAVTDKTDYASQTMNWTDTSKAVVVMENPTDIPTSLVVLINTGKGVNDLKGKTVADLQGTAFMADYSTTTNGIVMSNAVYNDASGNVVGAPVDPSNVCETPNDARSNPVKVYVDRVLAKVTVKNSLAENAPVSDAEDEKITVTLTGWSLVYNNTQSYLIKNLGTDYDFAWTWNDAAAFRSYWADAATYTMGAFPKYNAITKAFGKDVYTQENTAFQNFAEPTTNEETGAVTNPTENPTAVIVAATLKYDGQSTSLYKFRGVVYPEAEFKTYLADLVKYYKVDVADDGTKTYTRLLAADFDDLQFDANEGASYEAKVYLKLAATTGTFADANKEEKTAEQVNTALAEAGQVVEFWNGGATYYYVPIKQHVDTDATKDVFGIVRNHYYELTVKSVAGLGTAVPNPEQEIVPVTPEEKDYWIAAIINILDWKAVPQNVDLGK